MLDRFLLRNIAFSEQYAAAIEQKQVAEQERIQADYTAERMRKLATGTRDKYEIEAEGKATAIKIEADAQAQANKIISNSLTPILLQLEQVQVQGKFNDALRENKDAKIFLTPGGSTPNIWVDMKDPQRQSAIK